MDRQSKMAFFRSNQALSIVCTNRKMKKKAKIAPKNEIVPKSEFAHARPFLLLHSISVQIVHHELTFFISVKLTFLMIQTVIISAFAVLKISTNLFNYRVSFAKSSFSGQADLNSQYTRHLSSTFPNVISHEIPNLQRKLETVARFFIAKVQGWYSQPCRVRIDHCEVLQD